MEAYMGVLRISFREDCYEVTSIPVKQDADGEWAVYGKFLVKDGKGSTLLTHYKNTNGELMLPTSPTLTCQSVRIIWMST